MKRNGWRGFLLAGAALLVLVVFFSVTVASAGEYYYHSGGKRIELTVSQDYVMGPASSTTSTVSALSASVGVTLVPKQTLPGNKFMLYKVSGSGTSASSSLLSASSAGAAAGGVSPVFEVGETLMIPMDELIVRFPAGTEKSTVLEIGNKYGAEIDREASWSSDTYVMKVTGGNALDVANAIAENESVVYSLPNFVRVIDRRSETPPRSSETLILDSKGKRLPSDTKIPKGSTSYVTRERASMVLPGGAVAGSGVDANSVSPYTTVFSDGFEGSFPGTTWTVSGSPAWTKSTARKYAGSYSVYCAGTASSYSADMETWMYAGPYSLSSAQEARLNFLGWVNTESGYDFLWAMVSTDGTNFHGYQFSGDWESTSSESNGWVDFAIDVKDALDVDTLDGISQIYIAFIFTSDSIVQYEGAYVDKVSLEKVTAYEHISTDVYDGYQWHLNNTGQTYGTVGVDISAKDAWSASSAAGSGVTVAVIDEGVDLSHPDLAANLVAGYDATGLGSNGAPSGDDAHGTCCSGIIAAVTDNSKGVAGIAHGAKIMPVRIAYDDGSGSWVTYDSWIADGITWATNNGADVLSNSWGGGSDSQAIDDAISNAKTSGRSGKGCVVVFSAGNDNTDVAYPGYLDTVISVAALSPCDQRKAPASCDGEYWWGSNYGAALDISAPGVLMYTTDISGSSGYETGDYIANFNGTSSAAPVVSGVAALVIGSNPTLTATQVEQILYSTADDLYTTGWDATSGYGRVNAQNAVLQALSGKLDRIGVIRAAVDNKSVMAMYEAPATTGSVLGSAVASVRSLGTGVTSVAQGSVLLSGGDQLAVMRTLDTGRQLLQVYNYPTALRSILGSVLVSDNNVGKTNGFMTLGDFDGDGQDEVALAVLTSAGTYRLYIYEMPTTIGGDIGPAVLGYANIKTDVTGLTAADFDADGKADIVVLRTSSTGVSSVEVLPPPTKVNAAYPTPLGKYTNLGKNVIRNGVAVGRFIAGSSNQIAIAKTLASANCRLDVYSAPSGTQTTVPTAVTSFNNIGGSVEGILGCPSE